MSGRSIAKAKGMRFVIPMKEGLQPQELSDKLKESIYEEFASRYLESIGVEPTKANICALRYKHQIDATELELVAKFKATGCIRDELQVERPVVSRKLTHAVPITDADLFRKVVQAGEEMVEGGPIGNIDLLNEEEAEESLLPRIDNAEVVDKREIRDPYTPGKQVVQSALANFSSEYPLDRLNRQLTERQHSEIEKLLQCELMVDLVQTLCNFLHDHIFRMPELKHKRLLCQPGQTVPVPPLSQSAYESAIWRINEAYALLLAPYKRAKSLLSVVGVLVSFTARSVAKGLVAEEYPNWARSLDGTVFMEHADDVIMAQLDPNGYMRQIDLFGDGKTATAPHAAVGSRRWRGTKQSGKRKWMHQMYQLSPLMTSLAGSLMTDKSKAIITGARPAQASAHGVVPVKGGGDKRSQKRGETLDNVSRTKRVGSMATGVKWSLPYSQG